MADQSNYFTSKEAEQYAFFRIPKMLFKDQRFKNISTDAKVLYGLFLDRVSLSLKNGWLDEKDHVFIIYSIEEIMENMNCSNRKAVSILKELEMKVHLIEKKRQGLGKPNLIYVKNFFTMCTNDGYTQKNVDNSPEMKNSNFQKCKMITSRDEENTFPEVTKVHGNNTDNNNTDISNTDIHPTISERDGGMDGKEKEYQEMRSFLECQFGIRELIFDNPLDKGLLLGILDLTADICCTKKTYVNVGREEKPTPIVRERLMKLNMEHIRYVVKYMKDNPTRITDVRKYLLTILYNAPVTMEPYYLSLMKEHQRNNYQT